jgi:hypothetical protein
MCYGYEASARWRKEALDHQRDGLLKQQELERERIARETVRASQEAELRDLEKTLSRQKSGAKTH